MPGVVNLDAPAARSWRATSRRPFRRQRAYHQCRVVSGGERRCDRRAGWASCVRHRLRRNFYGILEPQKNFGGLETMSAGDVLRLSPIVRRLLNDKIQPVHPENPTIKA